MLKIFKSLLDRDIIQLGILYPIHIIHAKDRGRIHTELPVVGGVHFK